jgi:hypothetical protein
VVAQEHAQPLTAGGEDLRDAAFAMLMDAAGGFDSMDDVFLEPLSGVLGSSLTGGAMRSPFIVVLAYAKLYVVRTTSRPNAKIPFVSFISSMFPPLSGHGRALKFKDQTSGKSAF